MTYKKEIKFIETIIELDSNTLQKYVSNMYSDSFHSFKHLHKQLVCELENVKPIQIPNTTSDNAFDIRTISLLRNSLNFEKKQKTEENF